MAPCSLTSCFTPSWMVDVSHCDHENQGYHHCQCVRVCVCVSFWMYVHPPMRKATRGRSTGRPEKKTDVNKQTLSLTCPSLNARLSKHIPKYLPSSAVKEGWGNLEQNERQPLSCHQLFLGPKAPAEEQSHGGERGREREKERERDGSTSNYQPCQGDGR